MNKISRWYDEEKNPYSDLDWSLDNDDTKDVRYHVYQNREMKTDRPFIQVVSSILSTKNSYIGNFEEKWRIVYHPTTPAIQFETKIRKKINTIPYNNHFSCKFNELKNTYCMCCDGGIEKNAFNSLIRDEKDNKWWQEMHGILYEYYIQDDKIKDREIRIKIGKNEKKKIKNDAIEALGHFFKIRLNPKPEYQIFCLKKLFELFSDEKIYDLVDSFKVTIPYSKIINESNLSSIIIYPEMGMETAKKLLDSIIDIYSIYDNKELGMNRTPRFNKAYNELIYYSGGNGDDKLLLEQLGLLNKYTDRKDNNAFYNNFSLIPSNILSQTRLERLSLNKQNRSRTRSNERLSSVRSRSPPISSRLRKRSRSKK